MPKISAHYNRTLVFALSAHSDVCSLVPSHFRSGRALTITASLQPPTIPRNQSNPPEVQTHRPPHTFRAPEGLQLEAVSILNRVFKHECLGSTGDLTNQVFSSPPSYILTSALIFRFILVFISPMPQPFVPPPTCHFINRGSELKYTGVAASYLTLAVPVCPKETGWRIVVFRVHKSPPPS